METVVCFADISGFTNAAEQCAKKGIRGIEDLSFAINRYMEGMVKNLNKYGGDIIKFVGDALIIMWPSPNDPAQLSTSVITDDGVPIQHLLMKDTIRKSVQCALEIQAHMNNMQIMPGLTLSVKIGIGYGKCGLLYVGGVLDRSEFFTTGEALKQALGSEGMCTSGGQIVVAAPAFKYVSEFYANTELIDPQDNQKYYLVSRSTGTGVKIRADGALLRAQIQTDFLSRIQDKLRACVPAAIIPYLQISAENFGSETRSLTVMFASLGVALDSVETQEGMVLIQKIVKSVQQQVYRLQGSVNKLMIDDKGCTLLCLWGLTPFSHEDDAARAILTGFNVIKELNKIENTWCNAGFSSGECFSGVVGTAGSRKEFSVLGDVVNLAARIMGSLKKKKNAIACDLNTRMLAQNHFNFNYLCHSEFKGKSISLPIFEPINPHNDFEKARNKILSPESFLKVHMNPLNLERGNGKDNKVKHMTFGFKSNLQTLKQEIISFFDNNEPSEPFLATIKGELGSGKTVFALNLIEELSQSYEFRQYQNQYQKLPILTSTINPESDLQFLNMWRPILQMLMTYYCQRESTRREFILKSLLLSTSDSTGNENKRALISEILGIPNEGLKSSKNNQSARDIVGSIEPTYKNKFFEAHPFITRPDYSTEDRQAIIEILSNFVKLVIGEAEDVSGLMSFDNKNKSRQLESDDEDTQDRPPIIIVLDNAHLMDVASWQLYEALSDDCNRICIILLMQTDDQDDLKISLTDKEDKQIFESIWQNPNMEMMRVVDLPRFDQKVLKECLVHNSLKYQSSWTSEMQKMTEIVDPSNTLKNKVDSDSWKQRLPVLWQLSTQYRHIQEKILDIIVARCNGNPLLCSQYFVNLLQNDYIHIQSNGEVTAGKKFDLCFELHDWKTVPVPRVALKQMCTHLDRYLYAVQTKRNKKPGEVEACVTSIVMLKSATVLGDEFELKALAQIQPMRQANSSNKYLKESLKLLEKADLIEFVDETDFKNAVCRFNKPLLRESVYQMLLYKSCKKDLHIATERYLHQNPYTVDKDRSAEILKQHMLYAQDVETEDELSFERRTGLMVRRIQNMLTLSPKGFIIKEMIYKQGDAVNKKTSKRLVTLDANKLQWFHNDLELQQGKFLGSIELRFVYNVIKSYQDHTDKPTFMIGVTMWTDKRKEEKGKRDFFFSCDDILTRDKWMIAIDFLKTKAVYDAYSRKNRDVQFENNIQEKKEEVNHEEIDRVDMASLLYDFGSHLKGETKFLTKPNPTSLAANMGNMAQTLATMQKNENFNKNPRMSVLRHTASQQDNKQLSAHELVPKLRLLYTAGMTAFMQHVTTTSVKLTQKQQIAKLGLLSDRQAMILSDKVAKELEEDGSRENSQHGRSSISSGGARQTLMDTIGLGKDIRKNKKRDKINIKEQRRSSSISADNVASTPDPEISKTPLIQEVWNESDTSGEERRKNQHGTVSSELLNSDPSHVGRAAGRLSVEVNEKKLSQLKLTQSSETGRKGQSLANLKNSETSNRSSHSPITTDPINQNNRQSDNEAKNLDVNIVRQSKHLADRENRQTFASQNPSDNMSPSQQRRETKNPQSRPKDQFFTAEESGDAELLGGISGNQGFSLLSRSKYPNSKPRTDNRAAERSKTQPKLYNRTSGEYQDTEQMKEIDRGQFEFIGSSGRQREGTGLSSIRPPQNDSIKQIDLSGTLSESLEKNQQQPSKVQSRGTTESKRSPDMNERSQDFIAAISGMIDTKLNLGINKLMQTNLQAQEEMRKQMHAQQQDMINRSMVSGAYQARTMQSQGSFHSQYQPTANNAYGYNTPNKMNHLNVSQGGITSVKSHGKAFGNDPVQSKANSEMDDEPVDPGYDDLEDGQGHQNYAVLDLMKNYNRNPNVPLPVTSSEDMLSPNAQLTDIRRPITHLNSHSYMPLSDNENLYQQRAKQNLIAQSRQKLYSDEDEMSIKTLKPMQVHTAGSTRNMAPQGQIKDLRHQNTSRTTLDQFANQQQLIARNMNQRNPVINMQPTKLRFPEERVFFPPPEKWTENEYAMYEEPLIEQKNVSKSPANTRKSQINTTPTTQSVIVAARQSSCQLLGKRFIIEEGSQVNIQEALPHIKCYRVSHKGQSGIFPMRDFKQMNVNIVTQSHHSAQNTSSHKAQENSFQQLSQAFNSQTPQSMQFGAINNVPRSTNHSKHISMSGVQESTISVVSPLNLKEEHEPVRQNFFKEIPEKVLQQQMKQLSKRQLAQVSKRFLEEDSAQLKQSNLKLVERQRRKAADLRQKKSTSRGRK